MATVLIVEDEVCMSELLKEHLEEHGYKIITAYTGSKGLEAISVHKPDAVTLDIHLPDMSGIEILKKLKSHNISVPVIMVTSDDGKEKECREHKADGFINKPVNLEKLVEVVGLVIAASKGIDMGIKTLSLL